MLPAGLTSATEVSQYYNSRYLSLVNSGQAEPTIYPLITFGTFFVFLYLLIDHRGSRLLSSSRYLVFILFSIFQGWCVFTTVASNPAAAYGLGIVSAFSWFWVAVHVVINDCQVDYKRLQRVQPDKASHGEAEKRHGQQDSSNVSVGSLQPQPQRQLYWQAYPGSFKQRLSWVVDMFISFRGIGWSWQTAGVPQAPSWVLAQLNGKKTSSRADEVTVSRTGIRRLSNRRSLVSGSAARFIMGYFALDALKTLTMNDPYFFGYTDAPAPAFYPSFIQHSHVLTRSIRLLITMVYTSTALWTGFKLGPVFFAGILGPSWIGLSGEAWMNPPDMFGPFSNILDKGLAGFWGGFWHQVFRYVFEAPGTRLLEVLKIKKGSTAGKLISLAVAFSVSGCIHATGSYTQMGDTRPIKGPFTFFLLQGVGIALETLMWDAIKAAGLELPRWLKRAVNIAFALSWLYQTGPLLCDDFSQGGVWLFEPVPVSLFRYLGLRPADTGWWCWAEGLVSWHRGAHWFDTGLAV